jgi:hypothetical protein
MTHPLEQLAMKCEQRTLLVELGAADDRGAFCMACDGTSRAIAHELETLGLADWKGSSWGSQHWAITDLGRAALSKDQPL